MSDVDDTAKWSVGDRIKLAEGIARIEESLKRQDEQLEDLVLLAKSQSVRINKAERAIAENASRIYLHEKIAGIFAGCVGLICGLFKALRGMN
jgi:hypothetical protein